MKKTAMYPLLVGICILLAIGGAMAEPENGVIYINSSPGEAEIYLTNTSVHPDNLTVSDTRGFTPKEFFVQPGTYGIYLKKYGYTTWWNESFIVEAGKVVDFGTVTMTEKNAVYGAIHLDSNPFGADLVLNRVVPNVTSLIYSTTPASVESLPPGLYNYTLTKPGYYQYNGSTTVEAGNVTELYVPLVPIPDSADVTFRSDPSGARVLLIGGDFSDGTVASVMEDAETVLEEFNGSAEEAELEIKSLVGAETIPPVKIVAGLVGTTPFEMELHAGSYQYYYFLDGHHPVSGEFSVTAGNDMSVEEDMTPLTEYVGVYFETNVDGLPDADSGARVYVNGELAPNRTPCWVDLPSEKLVNVTFDKMPLFSPKSITVDSTLFVGRPSKWGQAIQLSVAKYWVTATADANSAIHPASIVVFAGDSTSFDLSGHGPKYLAGNLTVYRSDSNKTSVIPYNLPSATAMISNITGNATLHLQASVAQVIVNATVSKGGRVVDSEGHDLSGERSYDYGSDSLRYNFVNDTDYVQESLWVDNIQKSTDNWWEFYNLTTNHIIYAKFRPTKVWITHEVGTGGKLLDGGVPAVPYQIDYLGSTHAYEVVPDPGYHVNISNTRWTETDSLSALDSDISGESIIIPSRKATANMTLQLTFDEGSYRISARAEEGGIIDPSGNLTRGYGDELSFTITPFAGYELATVMDNGVSKGAVSPYNITVTEDHDIVANFRTDVLTITAVAGQGGKIEPNGTVNVTYNDSQCFNITANANYYITNVTVDGVNTGNLSRYCFENVTKDHNITAGFSQYAYTITPSASAGGMITPSTPQIVPIGNSSSFTITADGCHTIGDVLIDGTGIGPQISPFTYTFTDVGSDHTIHADFLVKTFSITVNQSEGGTITPNGTGGIVQVNCGSEQCFTITPFAGNVYTELIVDNVSANATSPYCFKNVTKDHTIEPVFVMPPEPDFGSDRIRVPPMYPVHFYDFTRNSPTDWLWDFGDGEITNVREPVHYYTAVGNYTVTLTAFNAAAPKGVSKVKENYITVTNEPIACINATPLGGTIPPGVQVQFTDCSLNTDGVSYGWNFGDDEEGSIAKNVTHTYTAPGVYQVTHKVEKPYVGSDYAYETITILQEPVADFIGHPVSGEAPLIVQFEDQSQGFPTAWTWMFGDSTGSYDQNPVHVYDTPGNYTVTLSVTSDEGTSTKTKQGYVVIK